MNHINVLIVEDESIVAMEIKHYIETLQYNVVGICSNAKDALALFTQQKVDILLMDICIKGERDGIETATDIKALYPSTIIIFLTAHMDEYTIDRAIMLNPMAYLSKPFHRKELQAFLKIATHKITTRYTDPTRSPSCVILDEEFCYDKDHNMLLYCTQSIHLTKKENDLLNILVQCKNSVVDFYTIANFIWPDKDIRTNTIRTLVRRLRQKLKHQFIETVSSQGYRLVTQ